MMQQARPVKTPAAAASRPRALIAIVAIVAIALAIRLIFFHENGFEKRADRVTKAIASNNMSPVLGEFNALTRVQLSNRAKVGQLSDFVNRQGNFKRTKEDTPKDAQPGFHHFLAEFDKGNLSEDMMLDADGKIANFHVRPLGAQ
ncbi:MAG: hypothetical protein M3R53_04725 [Candidatus Eremiobacteraeota bacterium]|nr:hypothetical protein [Candidatus Eremiobacteraeota bacterium]